MESLSCTQEPSLTQRNCYEGKVPVIFTLAAQEIMSLEIPPPYLVLLPRMSYLPLFVDEIKQYFIYHIPDIKEHIWFEYLSTPLECYLPIGLLYDLYSDQQLPWTITIHFSSLPPKHLSYSLASFHSFHHINDLKSIFINNIKEYFYLKFSSSRPIHSLSCELIQNFWNVIIENKSKPYFDTRSNFLHNISLSISTTTIKSIPSRIFIQHHPKFYQRLLPLYDQHGHPFSIDNTLRHGIPRLFELIFQYHIVIHGINIPLSTPLYWLSENMSYSDFFLNIIVVPFNKTKTS